MSVRRYLTDPKEKYICDLLFKTSLFVRHMLDISKMTNRIKPECLQADMFFWFPGSGFKKVKDVVAGWLKDFPDDYEAICKDQKCNKQDELYIRINEKCPPGLLLSQNLLMMHFLSVNINTIIDKMRLLNDKQLIRLKNICDFDFKFEGVYCDKHHQLSILQYVAIGGEGMQKFFDKIRKVCDDRLKFYMAISTLKRRWLYTYYNPCHERGQRHINKMFEECCS